MENLVVTLETAQALTAAAFPRDTVYGYFWWGDPSDKGESVLAASNENEARYMICAAPTAQEIADRLPVSIDHDYFMVIEPRTHNPGWYAGYFYEASEQHFSEGDTMAEALAALWLKLQEAK